MSDLVGNAKDRFSHDAAHLNRMSALEYKLDEVLIPLL